MKYLLDTNICIYIIKQKPINVLKKFQALQVNDLAISSITISELNYGVEKSSRIEQNKKALQNFILPIEIVDYDYKAAEIYGKIRAYLEKKGTPIGAMDMLIAAHALSLNIPLVTNNVKEFQRVPELEVVNWVE